MTACTECDGRGYIVLCQYSQPNCPNCPREKCKACAKAKRKKRAAIVAAKGEG